MQFLQETKIDFLGKRKIAMALSGLMILISIVMAAAFLVRMGQALKIIPSVTDNDHGKSE